MPSEMMAACGLDCGRCEIRLAPADPQAAESLMAWFRREGWLKPDEGMDQVIERKMYCCGCLGDRSTHWSADCWILACCVDDHGYLDCSECAAFPCERLAAWATQNAAYGEALARLKDTLLMREEH
jgi:Protein of unknown function (DUF3795)